MGSARVTFLGTGDAFSAGGHFQAAYLVEGQDTTFLLDCGASTLSALKRLGLDAGAVDTIVLSHLHGDHFAGIPFLFLEYMYQQPRQRPLRIAGPPGTPERVAQLFGATYRELAREPLPFPVEFVELRPDIAVDLGPVRLDPFRVPHQDNDISLGVRTSVAGATILYSGDTGWTEELVRHSEGTDLFICECSFFQTRMAMHLDYPRLAEHRHRFGTRRLVLTHLGAEVLARRAEITEELATEGLVIDV